MGAAAGFLQYRHNQKLAQEAAAARRRNTSAQVQAQYYYRKSRDAYYRGDNDAERAYAREAERWRNV